MKFTVKLFYMLVLFPFVLFAQGKSFYKTYIPKEYNAHAQNWCALQDNDGIMYFGNTIGLLIYDGENWQSLKLNNSVVRSLDKDNKGTIYYGAQGEFGYLYKNKKGQIVGKSLVDLLPDSLQLFGDVWKTYTFNNKVIFQTYDYLFIFENNKITAIEADNVFHFGYKRAQDFYIIDREIGLKKLNNNKLIELKGGDFFRKFRIYGWINFPDYALVATREEGVFKVVFQNNDSIVITPFNTEINEELIKGEVYCATQLKNGNLAFGTLYQGLYLTDNEGKLLKIINKSDGLKSEMVRWCYEDNQQGLWLALNMGITRVEVSNNIESFGEEQLLEGIVTSFVSFNGNYYCGTSKGLFEITDNGVKRFVDFNNDVRHIHKIKFNHQELLIVLTEVGTYKLDKNNKLVQLNDENGLFLTQSKYYPNICYFGAMSGLEIMNLENYTMIKINHEPIPEVRKIVEENESTIWLGTSHNGVYKIKNLLTKTPSFYSYDTLSGLPNVSYNLPFLVKNNILFGTYNGIYIYDSISNKFKQFKAYAHNNYKSGDQIYQLIEGLNDNLWLFKTNETIHEFISYNFKTKAASLPLKRMNDYDAYQCIYPENKNITWFGGPDGLFRYDASKPSMDSIPFKTKIRGVYCMNDTLFGGYYGFNENGKKIEKQHESLVPELIYKNNNINFEFAALSFDNEKENVYSYYLEGFENTWSDWTSESKKSYTNLNEGTYTFHIKSKNVYGKEGDEDTYTFTILPPWYRTGWAYLAYAIGAIVLVYLITQISVRRLKSAKIKLEAIVVNRTAEVVAEKEEVEKQKKIVEVKNKDITDSINYAQRIQQAILPLPEDISKVFPESFIYFQPRDIVSGDFYWFYTSKRKDKKWVYIAAADCTGHGVPGAFMSMIGNTLLNEILNEKQIYETDQILNQLHIEVRAALKQDTAQNTTNDGMDIALVRVDLDTLELQFSGANRALYIFKNGKDFVDIKPNKFPIGGYQAEITRSFTSHIIQLQQKDTFYIFSDGYADQFGGASNKKFMVKRLQTELMAMQNLPMHEQKYLVEKLVMDWKGDAEQVDDILLIGVKV